jgi:hypothetical protein
MVVQWAAYNERYSIVKNQTILVKIYDANLNVFINGVLRFITANMRANNLHLTLFITAYRSNFRL